MKQSIGQIALVVADYDEAIEFYTKKLHFELLEDTTLSETKRWVVVSPKGNSGCNLLLAKAASEEQLLRVGNQTGGRVFLFMYTDDINRDHQNLLQQNIRIVREPHEESWGKVLVFADLYGNLWDLIELGKVAGDE
jgi:catechol 2,3-dioxygenase-like lactoylglutathione lyase family enzyme